MQYLVAEDKRQKLARVAKDMLGTEALFNLRELTSINSSLMRTAEAQKPVTIKSAGAGLRKAVFERLVNPEVIDALTARESGYTVETLFDLGGIEDAAATLRALRGLLPEATTWRYGRESRVQHMAQRGHNRRTKPDEPLLTVHSNDGEFRSHKHIAKATADVHDFYRSIGRGGEELSNRSF